MYIMQSRAEEKTPCLSEKKSTSTETSMCRMIFLGMVVVSPGLLDGICSTFSGIALPQMNLNIDDASWFGSIQTTGSLISSIIGGLVIDKFGRRPLTILAIVPATVGWFLISIGSGSTVIIVGRILTGVTFGVTYIGQVYVAECIVVNHHHLRNHFSTWYMMVNAAGQLLCYVLATLLQYRQVAAVTAIIGVVISVCICRYIPESPQWLYKKGRLTEARHSEARLCIHQPILNREDEPDRDSSASRKVSLTKGFQRFKKKNVYRPLYILTIWLLLISFNGGPILLSYMVDMLKTNGTVQASEYNLSVISGVCSLVGVVLMSSIILRTGVKLLFISSTLCMAVGSVAYGVSEYQIGNWQSALDTIHVLSVWVMMFFYTFGTVTVALSVIGEMFPHDVKGLASIPIIIFSVAAAVAVKLHPYLQAYLGGSVYFLYAFFNVANMIFTAAFVPETVGKTLDEISRGFLK